MRLFYVLPPYTILLFIKAGIFNHLELKVGIILKAFFKDSPSISFLVIAFSITFGMWFLPVFVNMPIDVKYGTIMLGSCGPLLSGLIITAVKSETRIRIHSIPIFVGIFILCTIVLVLVSMTTKQNKIPKLDDFSVLGFILYFLMAFIVSLNFSNATNNNLKENYIKSMIPEKGKYKWYAFAFFFLFIVSLLTYMIGKLFALETTDFIFTSDPIRLLSLFYTFLFVGGNEEFGWRGFLQKEMQKKYNPLVATFVIYLAWTLWHLPLHYNGFYSTGGFMDILPRFIWTFPLTIAYTWLYNKSSYALLSVMILHAIWNNFRMITGYSSDLFYPVLIIVALYCLIDGKMWKKQSFDYIYAEAENKTA